MLVSIFGDSISTYENMNPEGYLVFYDLAHRMLNSLMSADETWWGRLLADNGWELLVNASYSGSRVTGDEFPSGCSQERIDALKTDRTPELILVYLGYNDYGFCVPPDSFESACALMLERLKRTYPDSRIVCATLLPTYVFYRPDISERLNVNEQGVSLDTYSDVIRRVCKSSGVDVADLAATGIKMDTLDGSHGTLGGHRELFTAWKQALEQIKENRE